MFKTNDFSSKSELKLFTWNSKNVHSFVKFHPKLIKTRKGCIQFDFVQAQTKSTDTSVHPTFNFQLVFILFSTLTSYMKFACDMDSGTLEDF